MCVYAHIYIHLILLSPRVPAFTSNIHFYVSLKIAQGQILRASLVTSITTTFLLVSYLIPASSGSTGVFLVKCLLSGKNVFKGLLNFYFKLRLPTNN